MEMLDVLTDIAEFTFTGVRYVDDSQIQKIGALSAFLVFMTIAAFVIPNAQF